MITSPLDNIRLRRVLFALSLVFTLACLLWFARTLWLRSADILLALPRLLADTPLLVTEIILLALNILVETLRWQVLYSSATPCHLSHAVKTVLTASALGNSSPANIGEHVARTVDSNDKKSAATLSLLASALTSASILILGALSAALLCLSDATSLLSTSLSSLSLLALSVASLAILVAVLAVTLSSRVKSLVSSTLALVGLRRMSLALALGCLRVIIFSAQFYILLASGSDTLSSPLFPLLPLVFVYYFLLTFLPRLNLLDIGVKGSLALALIPPSLVPPHVVCSATLLVWLVNIFLPSLAGFAILLLSRLHR